VYIIKGGFFMFKLNNADVKELAEKITNKLNDNTEYNELRNQIKERKLQLSEEYNIDAKIFSNLEKNLDERRMLEYELFSKGLTEIELHDLIDSFNMLSSLEYEVKIDIIMPYVKARTA
jgi:hypothetical protein